MSLIPYRPQEGGEIVLRHRNAIVVRDTTSQRLEIRGITECPACHRPFQRGSAASDRAYDQTSFEMNPESYVDPGYFRMLHPGSYADSETSNGPPSPVRRPIGPASSLHSTAQDEERRRERSTPQPSVADAETELGGEAPAEFMSSVPSVTQAEGSKIRREAFSQNYFRTFFVEEKVLGKGGKGVVLLVRHEIDGCHLGHFACKRVPVGNDHAWLEKVLVEVELLAKLSHPNLVSYRHVWLEDVGLTRFGPSVVCAFILQQYCNNGDLHQYVIGSVPKEATKEELKAQMRRRSKGHAERPKNLDESQHQLSLEEIYTLFKDITSGVAYLHANGYIHRDLKPSNCLLHSESGRTMCLISDFGEVQAENVVRKSSGSTGTISYCAPEVLKHDASGRYGNFTTKSDVFSLGMILYFMCFGRLPYRSANAIQEELEDMDLLRAEIKDWQGFADERRARPELPSKLYSLLRQLLSANPIERPNASDVLGAMKSEANFDGMRRAERSSSPSLASRGSRVQNLDSPAQLSPAPDPQKRHSRSHGGMRSPDTAWSSSISRETSPRLKGTPTLRPPDDLPSQAMELSHSQEGYRAPVIDPEDGELSPGLHELYHRPLLMAPPRGRLAEARYSVAQSLAPMAPTQVSVGYAVSMALFLVRVASLTWPCWPYMPSPAVGVPLLVLAAADLLGFAPSRPAPSNVVVARDHYSVQRGVRKLSVFLLLVHVATMTVAQRSHALCVRPYPDKWDDW